MASYLRQKGHEVHLVVFKKFQGFGVPATNAEAWARINAATYKPVRERHEECDYIAPYIAPATEREWELLIERLRAIRPDVIGLTVPSSMFDAAREATERIRRALPGAPVVWGGVHPTIMPEECIEIADMVVGGEGEEAMAELCADPARTDIRGLWQRRGGEVIQNPIRPLEQDLDRFPDASYGENEWLIEDNEAREMPASNKSYYRAIYMIMTQRGCPFQCTYCVHSVTRAMHKGERYFRRRSVDRVLDECVRRAREFGLDGFAFFDDVFVVHAEWIDEFVEKWPGRVGMPFGGYAYPLVSNEEMFRKLRAVGMVFTGIGIQTGSDYIGREIYGRRYDSDKIAELAWMAHRQGLKMSYEVLTGSPYESEEDCLATLKLLLRMPSPAELMCKKLVMYPRLPVNTIDRPRPNLSDATFNFYIALYLLARHQLIAPERMLELAGDEYLKANPEILMAVAMGIRRAVEQREANRAELEQLVAEQSRYTVRKLARYGKRVVMNHLPAPVAERLRSVRRKL
jgi:radical SAM superfamily enzyme YgiQ (UPF0313 family)